MPRKKTHEQFVAEVEAMEGGDYTVIGTYNLSHLKLDMKHNVCDTIYPVRPSDFIKGNRCPKCTEEKRKTLIIQKAKEKQEKASQ